MEEIASRVEKQELEIHYIKKTLDELVEQNKKQNEQLIKISESIQKQEIILERVSNLEEKYQDGMKRVHQRIDNELSRHKEIFIQKNNEKYELIKKDIDFIKEKQDRHAKIFWWGGTLILGVIIVAIVKSALK